MSSNRRDRRFTWALAAVALLAVPQLAVAQSSREGPGSLQYQALEERLRQQDQRIKELERRLQELEAAGGVSAKAAPAEAPAAQSASQAPEQDEHELVGDLNDPHQLLTAADLTAEDFPGSWPMFGTDMRMKVGGYIKSDFVIDLDGTLDETQFLMSTIPVPEMPEYANDGYVSFFAKESRFNLDLRRVMPGATPLRGFLEGDFFSSGNQFRLRHAYMTVGDFLIGQTWTTLSFLESMPYMIDFAAGDALFGGRAAQIRYQHKVNEHWKMSAALEELSFLGIENPNNFQGKASRQSPLLALRADYRWDNGLLLMGSSIAQLHWDGGASGPSDSALQYDFVVAGRQNLGPSSYWTWNVSYGEGSGENIMAFAGSNANAVLNANGKLDTFPAFAVVLGLGRNWNSAWSSNLSYAYGWLDTPESRDPLSLKRGGIGHVNLIWKPVQQFSTGMEFMWGTVRVQDGSLGRAERIQMMGKFEF